MRVLGRWSPICRRAFRSGLTRLASVVSRLLHSPRRCSRSQHVTVAVSCPKPCRFPSMAVIKGSGFTRPWTDENRCHLCCVVPMERSCTRTRRLAEATMGWRCVFPAEATTTRCDAVMKRLPGAICPLFAKIELCSFPTTPPTTTPTRVRLQRRSQRSQHYGSNRRLFF